MHLYIFRKWGVNTFIDWFIYLLSYTIILITVSILFDSIYIDNAYFGLWAFIASLIIHLLNKTLRPILVILTLPITSLTLGLFYPFINVLILKITDWLLGEHFITSGIFVLFFIAILISFLNFLMDQFVVSPLMKRGEIDE